MKRTSLLPFLLVIFSMFFINNYSQAQLWTACYNGMFNGVYGVSCIEKAGNYLFAGTIDYSAPTVNATLYRSSDNGKNWFAMDCATSYYNLNTIFVSGSEIYAGTEGGGMYYSSNLGQNWDIRGPGTITAICKTGPNLLMADMFATIFFSTNNGINWSPVANWPAYNPCYTFLILNNKVFAGSSLGVFVSSDDGITWSARSSNIINVKKLYYFENSLYACSTDSIYKSTNEGINWSGCSTGITYPSAYSMSSINSMLFVGTFNGVYSSSNNGNYWNPAYFGMGRSKVSALLSSDNILYAGVTFAGSGPRYGLFSSSNNGQYWRRAGLNNFRVTCMILSDSTIFVGTDSSGVYFSTDEGNTWSPAKNELNNNYIYNLTKHGLNLFAGTVDSGVYKSTNNGQNWSCINNGIGNLFIKSFLSKDSILYAGTNNGIYKTTNNGTNWIYFGLSSTPINSMLNYYSNFLAGSDNGILISTNNGVNWTLGILSGKSIKAFYVFQDKIFCGTNSGIYTSSNYGLSWSLNGLSEYTANSFADFSDTLVCSTNNGVYASSNNGINWIWLGPNHEAGRATKSIFIYKGNIFTSGLREWLDDYSNSGCVLKRIASTTSGIKTINSDIISDYHLYQNYPNPFNPSTTIRYSIPKSGLTKIVIYDILGREIAILVKENQIAGTFEVTFNASQYPSGIYFYTLKTNNFIETKKMLLLK